MKSLTTLFLVTFLLSFQNRAHGSVKFYEGSTIYYKVGDPNGPLELKDIGGRCFLRVDAKNGFLKVAREFRDSSKEISYLLAIVSEDRELMKAEKRGGYSDELLLVTKKSGLIPYGQYRYTAMLEEEISGWYQKIQHEEVCELFKEITKMDFESIFN